MQRIHALLVSALLFSVGLSQAHAGPVLWIGDSTGRLGKVDVGTNTVSVVGGMGVVMTDLAFSPTGDLYGMSFTNLYKIDKSTGASTLIGAHGISGGNALVFGADGTLYGAGGALLYSINTGTGAGSLLGNMGYSSGGDLAFQGGNLFLATSSNLVQISLPSASGTLVGAFGGGRNLVYGMATAGGILYGVNNTSIFSIDSATGAGTALINYGGQGLGNAYGTTFFAEAASVPEPSTLAGFAVATCFTIGLVRRKGRSMTS
ncbi:MAG: PEP-CTERM sorting domain-containing protein [Isosphaeraceae bacterium]|nr:PEP-CTERM sorting domain-containing protein [Isosphaeraceae bacterium]